VGRPLLLLALDSAVILEIRVPLNHILLSQILDSPNMERQVPVFIYPRNRVAQLYPQALGSSPPTTRMVTVKVLESTSTRVS
jgi:hypothetical protein